MGSAEPIDSTQRIGELDVLRGFALFGVFIVHFVGGVFYQLSVDPAWQALQKADPLQNGALLFSDLFFLDKANTLFATLFGMGFWVMMERLKARGVAFEMIYFRRLVVLLLIGVVNVFLIFPGDVLHVYAVLGMVLLALRGIPMWAKLGFGVILVVGGKAIGDFILPNAKQGGTMFETVQAAAFAKGDYANWVLTTGEAFMLREFVYGASLGWGLYLFGRFLIGAWIMERGWMDRLGENLVTIRWLAAIALPLGLALDAAALAIDEKFIPGPEGAYTAIHPFSVPLQALGYALVLILLFHSRWKGIVLVFAPVGRMALTTYVLHGAVLMALFSTIGLGFSGVMPPFACLLFLVALFGVMTAACHWWLARYRYGPLEYVWRWATYGERPKFRLAPAPVAA
ncbi:MAG: DUF418 domain-containing protein, partial [Pseudomonadota bacterium]